MLRTRAVRAVAALVVGLAAGAAAWRGLAPVEPFLEVTVRLESRLEAYEIWKVVVKVRGGESIDEIRVEPASGPAHVITPPRAGLASGLGTAFRVQLDAVRAPGAVVRVVQTGRVSRTYDARLEETP